MAWSSLMELLNKAPSIEIINKVEECVTTCLTDLPVQELFVRVLQPGRTRMVSVHVVLPASYEVKRLSDLDGIRSITLNKLKEIHPSTFVDIIFTADRYWGAPIKSNNEQIQ